MSQNLFAGAPLEPKDRKSIPNSDWSTPILIGSIAILLTALCSVGAIALSTIADKRAPTSSPYVNPTASKVPPIAGPRVPTITDGTWTVVEDIPAGKYAATSTDDTCYWEISKEGSNGLDIYDNSLAGKGHLEVTLSKGEVFLTRDCGIWTKVG